MALTTLTVDINSDIKGLQKGLKKAQRKMKSAGKSMRRVGSSLTQNVTVPITAMGGAAIKAAGDFEEAMVEVEKVTTPETAKELSGDIREMAETIPLAQTKLANLTAQAARFGVRGTDNIRDFTVAVSKMSIATDLSADRAGKALAKIGKLTDVPASKMENLGSAVNELANNFATSSSEITDSMLRAGAAASQFGLNAQQLAGVSAALNAVSESSQRAGTRLRRVFQQLLNPKKMEAIAGAIGMTSQEFTKLRNNSPVNAVMQLVNAMEEGGAKADALRSELSTVSQQALSGLAQNADGVRQALQQSGKAFQENTSLQEEFSAATDTLYSKLTLLWNRLKNVGITIGNILIPAIEKIIGKVEDLTAGFNSLSKNAQKQFVKVGIAIAAIPPAIYAIGTAISGISTVMAGVSAVFSAPFLTGVAVAGLVVAAFAEVVVAGQSLVDNWKKISAYIEGGARSVGVAFQKMAKVGIIGIRELIQFIINNSSIFTKLAQALGYDAGEFTTKALGFDDALNSLQSSIDEGKKKTKNAIKEYRNLDWVSISESAKFAFGKIKDGISYGLDKALSATGIKKKIAQIQQMLNFDAPSVGGGGETNVADKINIGKAELPQADFEKSLNPDLSKLKQVPGKMFDIQDAIGKTTNKAKGLGQALQSQVSSSISSFAETLGNAFTGDAGAKGFFNSILLIVTDFAKRFGKLLIGAGTAALAFENLLANPVAAIVAGTALIAAATAVKNLLKSGPSSDQGGSGQKAPALAQGGLAFGPTMAMVGDNKGARSNPEVIAPLDKLEGMMQGQGGTQRVVVEGRLRGEDIYLSNERGQTKFNR